MLAFVGSLATVDWALIKASDRADTNTVINCADGAFLSNIVHASIDYPNPNQPPDPRAVASARAELARLDPILRSNCAGR